MREYKTVYGKCHCCDQLKALLKESNLPSDRLEAREYKMLQD